MNARAIHYKIGVQWATAAQVNANFYREDEPTIKDRFATIDVGECAIFVNRTPEGFALARAIIAAATEILDRYDPQPSADEVAEAALVETAGCDEPIVVPVAPFVATAMIDEDIIDDIYRDPKGGLWRFCGAGVHPAEPDGRIVHGTHCQGFNAVMVEHGTLTLIWSDGKPVAR